jgi:PhzF family phenazine biosynthesis protein
MKLKLFQIDAFTDRLFSGNPAAVVPLQEWLPTEVMQDIAMENNLSETAFFVPEGDGFHIRWFTPVSEVNLCGHATLATAHVLFRHLNYTAEEIRFHSKSGWLKIRKENDLILLDFPASEVNETEIPDGIKSALGLMPQRCFKGREDLMFVFRNEAEIRQISPDFNLLKKLDTRGIIVTAPASAYDFVSRFFAPVEGIDEDPVTGSAHTMLTPYWSGKLGKKNLVARQISKRGGTLWCKNRGKRTEIGGKAKTYLVGEITFYM